MAQIGHLGVRIDAENNALHDPDKRIAGAEVSRQCNQHCGLSLLRLENSDHPPAFEVDRFCRSCATLFGIAHNSRLVEKCACFLLADCFRDCDGLPQVRWVDRT